MFEGRVAVSKLTLFETTHSETNYPDVKRPARESAAQAHKVFFKAAGVS
jgi:hypothetical protein